MQKKAPAKPWRPKKQATKKPVAKPAAKPAKPAAKPGPKTAPPFAHLPQVKRPATLHIGGAAPHAKRPSSDPRQNDKVAPLTDKQLLKHFRKTLQPHGQWTRDRTYGVVWVPNKSEVGESFAPYRSNGRWALTRSNKWAWASDYKWGAVPFHYGRWVSTKKKGWAWIPGTEHAPAWVVWRVADAKKPFVGWAPMSPTQHWIDRAQESKGQDMFNYVPARYLFNPKVESFVMSDSAMAKKMHADSHVYRGHAGVDAARIGVLRPASPTLRDGNVPKQAVPRSLLSDDHTSIAPITAKLLHAKRQQKLAKTQRLRQRIEEVKLASARVKEANAALAAARKLEHTATKEARTLRRQRVAAARQVRAATMAARAAKAAVNAEKQAIKRAEQEANAPLPEPPPVQPPVELLNPFATPPDGQQQGRRFATPPEGDAAQQPSRRHLSRAQVKRMRHQAKLRRKAQRRRRIQRHRKHSPRSSKLRDMPKQRCGWTNQRPRQWRCGPTTRRLPGKR